MIIKLPSGHEVLIDDEDYELVKPYRWWFHADGYAYTIIKKDKKYVKNLLMHKLIMNTPKGKDTDHRNRNGLDNRRANLRITSRTQNNYNSGLRVDNKSGVKGVNWFKPAKLWRAYIGGGKNRVELGYFKTLEKAAEARLEAEKKYIEPAL